MARKQLVVFKVGTEEFAADIMVTKEVVLMREITPVPETERYVEGVMNLRGHLVPVLDLSKRLRAFRPALARDRRIIITNLDGRLAGLIVDGTSEVIRVTDEMIEAVPDLISEIGADYVQGVVNLNGRFITLIDFEKALSGEVAGEFDRVMEVLSRQRESVAPAQAV
ncbi:MAG TPA: chemotaxis protein CheW [Blastocatellia bacterium]|nr:chemotaxis protein CheW [Blastocatellia bacterium]